MRSAHPGDLSTASAALPPWKKLYHPGWKNVYHFLEGSLPVSPTSRGRDGTNLTRENNCDPGRRDFHVGAELDSLGAPVVRRCPNAATVTGVPKSGGSEIWMCEECWGRRSEMFVRRVPIKA